MSGPVCQIGYRMVQQLRLQHRNSQNVHAACRSQGPTDPTAIWQWLVRLSVAIQTLFPAWGFEEKKPFFRPPPNPSTFRLDSSVSFLFCSRAAKARCIMASATSFRSSTASCPSAPSVGLTVLSLFPSLLPFLMPSSCLASGLRRVASSGGTSSSSSSIDPLGCCPEGKKPAKIRDSLTL